MPVGKLILLGLLGLVVAEAAVFLMAAQVFGSAVALVALFATSVLGALVLARMGRRLAGRLADLMSHREIGIPETRSNGFLTTAGGILLVLPGFITDCVGLLLLVPAVQRRLIDRARIGRPRPAGRVLDLDRTQWRDLPDRHIDRESPPKQRRTR